MLRCRIYTCHDYADEYEQTQSFDPEHGHMLHCIEFFRILYFLLTSVFSAFCSLISIMHCKILFPSDFFSDLFSRILSPLHTSLARPKGSDVENEISIKNAKDRSKRSERKRMIKFYVKKYFLCRFSLSFVGYSPFFDGRRHTGSIATWRKQEQKTKRRGERERREKEEQEKIEITSDLRTSHAWWWRRRWWKGIGGIVKRLT